MLEMSLSTPQANFDKADDRGRSLPTYAALSFQALYGIIECIEIITDW